MRPYTKQFLSLFDQLSLLKSRGLQVADDIAAQDCLRRNGYYRLSAYWYIFRDNAPGATVDRFKNDSHFEDAVELYKFDKKFKLLMLDAIERVEIASRVEIAMLLGPRNRYAQADKTMFHPKFTTKKNFKGDTEYDIWLRKFNARAEESRDEFVLHHKREYGAQTPLPIWIAIELWDFGLLSHAFKGLKYNDQQGIAARFAVADGQLMESWLHTLNYVRNVIAHHGRLWNANLSVNPKLPAHGQIPDFDALLPLPHIGARIYSVCCILAYLTRVINPQSLWIKDMKALIKNFPPMTHAGIHNMGFPADWETHGFWK